MQTTKKDDALLEACVVALGAFIERNSPRPGQRLLRRAPASVKLPRLSSAHPKISNSKKIWAPQT